MPGEYERIERYLEGRMSGSEKVAFESDMGSDPVLEDKVKEVIAMREGVETLVMKEKMEGFHTELETPIPQPYRQRWIIWTAAASIAVILSLGIWWMTNRPSMYGQLFEAYYTQDPGLVTAMAEPNGNYEFDRGMIDYKSGKFDEAIARWKKLKTAKPENDTLLYFIGVSYLAGYNVEEALPYLEQVSTRQESNFWNDANWYVGLIYLKKENRKEAIAALKKSGRKESAEIMQRIEYEAIK